LLVEFTRSFYEMFVQPIDTTGFLLRSVVFTQA